MQRWRAIGPKNWENKREIRERLRDRFYGHRGSVKPRHGFVIMAARRLLTTEQALDFLQASHTQRAREDTFFLEPEVPLLLGKSAEFIRL